MNLYWEEGRPGARPVVHDALAGLSVQTPEALVPIAAVDGAKGPGVQLVNPE